MHKEAVSTSMETRDVGVVFPGSEALDVLGFKAGETPFSCTFSGSNNHTIT